VSKGVVFVPLLARSSSAVLSSALCALRSSSGQPHATQTLDNTGKYSLIPVVRCFIKQWKPKASYAQNLII
jgi:hypothetical protein